MRLIEFTNILEEQYLSYINEWEQTGEDIVPSAAKRNNLSFNELIQKWHSDKTDGSYKKGFVPSTLYFFVG